MGLRTGGKTVYNTAATKSTVGEESAFGLMYENTPVVMNKEKTVR